jgi:hypothetical protein
MKYAIAEAEKHPEIRPDAAATAQEVADLRCLVATYANEATEAKAEIERLRTQATGVQENWAIFDQAMNMLADVPGGTMLERITRLKEWYQQLCGTHAQRADTSADVSTTKGSE